MSKWIVKYKDELMDDEVVEADFVSFQHPGLVALQKAKTSGLVAVFNIDVIISIKLLEERQ